MASEEPSFQIVTLTFKSFVFLLNQFPPFQQISSLYFPPYVSFNPYVYRTAEHFTDYYIYGKIVGSDIDASWGDCYNPVLLH